VYIKEAHPSDGAQTQANILEGIILPTPATLEQRESYADQAAAYLNIPFTAAIDTMDDHVESLYAAWPLRLYLVGTDGRLVYVGRSGPRDFYPSELENAIRPYVGLDGVTATSAASYTRTIVAPGSIGAVFGTDLAASTESAASTPLPLSLAGASVTLTDSLGAERAAPLFFVSPAQINLLVPPETTLGPGTVTVKSGAQMVLKGPLLVRKSAPGLFSANADGQGVAAAVAVRVAQDDTQTATIAFRFDDAQKKCVPVPVDMGTASEKLVLLLFGTGIRGVDAPPAVTVGGIHADVEYAGPQADFAGLDQVNVLLPRSLAGRGSVDIVLTADGVKSNTVKVTLK